MFGFVRFVAKAFTRSAETRPPKRRWHAFLAGGTRSKLIGPTALTDVNRSFVTPSRRSKPTTISSSAVDAPAGPQPRPGILSGRLGPITAAVMFFITLGGLIVYGSGAHPLDRYRRFSSGPG
jgi:hypothetical protein